MYLGNHEIKSIEGFLIGFEMANNDEVSFHRKLMQNIFNRHRNISAMADMEKGNVHLLFRQIEEIAKNKVVEAINQDLRNLTNQKDENSRTMSSIVQLHKIIGEWKGENLDIETQELISQLKDLHIGSLTGWMKNSEKVDKSVRIKEISNQIITQLNG